VGLFDYRPLLFDKIDKENFCRLYRWSYSDRGSLRLLALCGFAPVCSKRENFMWKRSAAAVNESMLVLFKFGREEHLKAFREQGMLHMRTMRHFAAEEKGNIARGDRFEGASTIIQPAHLKMTLSHPILGVHEVDPRDVVGPVILAYDAEAEQNIFCMFSLTEPTPKPLLCDEYLSFGDFFVLVLNAEEFLNRVKRAVMAAKLEGEAGPVTYYDDATYSGRIGPFQKPSVFGYQKEFRIVLRPGTTPFLNLMVGDLSDVTTPVLRLSELDTICDFTERSADEAGWLRA
jgi:hypothetical protein